MTTDPAALLDQLDAAHAAGSTEGPWVAERMFWKLGSTRGVEDGWWQHILDDAGTVALLSEQDDEGHGDTAAARAALIVAAVNQLPQLTAALRAVLALADRLGSGDATSQPDSTYAGVLIAQAVAADEIRTAIASSLTHPTNQEGATR